MMDKVLLTGGAGYIGAHVYLELASAGFTPVIFDNFSNADPSVIGALEAITGRPVVWMRGDVTDAAALGAALDDGPFAGVIHFAALKSVPDSVGHPARYFHNNVVGLVTLLGAMEAAGLRRLVFSSSATVYGRPVILPIPEFAPRRHTNPYGFTKLAGEEMLEMLANADRRWAIGTLRYFNPAGAHPSGLIGESVSMTATNLFPSLARVARGEADSFTIHGTDYDTRDGTAERDYIHVEDLAAGHVQSLLRLIESGRGHTVNLGTGRGHTVMEVLKAYGRATGHPLPYRLATRRPGDVASCYADTTAAEALLGFRAHRGLEEMCASSWNSAAPRVRALAPALRA